MDSLLDRLSVPSEKLTENSDLRPQALFPSPYAEYWLEIGFGNGAHLEALIRQHPDIGFLGAEPYIDGMAAFLKSIHEEAPPPNIRVLMDDALLLVSSLADESIERLYILNPDPWPKTRHHKRRIIRPDTLDQYARILKPGGLLITSTDVDDLAEWIVTHTHKHPHFSWTARSQKDWNAPPAGWPLLTRFAEKGIEAGRTQRYMLFQRI